MYDIKRYVEEVKKGDLDGGKQRTKAYPFVEDGVILVNKLEENFDEKKKIIDACNEKGIGIPKLYEQYKDENGIYWTLEQLASGIELETLLGDPKIDEIWANIPYEHFYKYVYDAYQLNLSGIGLEAIPRNIFYDFDKGFSFIDVGLLSSEELGLNSIFDVNKFFSMHYIRLLRGNTSSTLNISFNKILRAFEEVVPDFKKYEKFLLRDSSSGCIKMAEENGMSLEMDQAEEKILLDEISKLVDTITNEVLVDEDAKFKKAHRIILLESSVPYCKNFNLYDRDKCTLKKYLFKKVDENIKQLFFNDVNNPNLQELYVSIRKSEIDPIHKYDNESLDEYVRAELNGILSEYRSKSILSDQLVEQLSLEESKLDDTLSNVKNRGFTMVWLLGIITCVIIALIIVFGVVLIK